MAEQNSGQERTEQPTPKRLKDAKKEGRVPRSKELSTFAVMLTSTFGLLVLGPSLLSEGATWLKGRFSFDRELLRSQNLEISLVTAFADAFLIMVPWVLLVMVSALMAPAALGGFSVSFKTIKPKLEKVSPAKGLKRIFGAQGLMELVKALAKFFLVMLVAGLVLRQVEGEVLGLATLDLLPALGRSGSLLSVSFVLLTLALAFIAASDVPFQLWQHQKKLKMTRQEIKDEMKQTEGRPEVKSRIRAMQQETARRRIDAEVPEATLVLTNPLRYAVALRYDAGDSAPKMVAKGAGPLAQRIREIAEENGIPILPSPPLTRSLYFNAKEGSQIPVALYQAVAQVLAYVMHVDRQSAARVGPPVIEAQDIPRRYRR